MSPLFLLLGAVALLLAWGSALFSAIETSLFSLQPMHVERLKRRREEFAAALAAMLENPRRLLSAILLADALVNLPLIIICLFLLHEALLPGVPFWAAALSRLHPPIARLLPDADQGLGIGGRWRLSADQLQLPQLR